MSLASQSSPKSSQECCVQLRLLLHNVANIVSEYEVLESQIITIAKALHNYDEPCRHTVLWNLSNHEAMDSHLDESAHM